MPSDNSKIIVCGQKFDVGQRVITYEDDPLISAYTLHNVSHPGIYPIQPAKGLGTIAARFRERRQLGADRSLSRLQQVLKQFVVHHDGMGTSRDTFRVLHDERGLSVHFLIDNNGDIYQTLDLVDCGFQAAGVNEISVGVELCSRGDAPTWPVELYKKYPREKVTCTINGHQWLSWNYTKEQFDAMVNLARALAKILPGLAQQCPMDSSGEPVWGTLNADDSPPREFSGYLGHYHVTNRKWDPGPWDFKKFIAQIKGRMFYPALPGKANLEIPDESEKAEELAHDLYDNNEKEGDAGWFPVGPLGWSLLWHSGIHLHDDRGKPVAAPFGGKVVAARFNEEGKWPAVGSNNFVLLKHELAAAGQPVKFFTLFMHVDEEKDEEKQPFWYKKNKAKLGGGDIALLDEQVGAGEVIAHFGEAGPLKLRDGQIHFEVMSEDDLAKTVGDSFWAPIDGSRTGRFCIDRSIIGHIDTNRNYVLEPAEVSKFFHTQGPARDSFRKVATRHVSEWGDNGDFETALNTAPEFKRYSPQQRAILFEGQIKSFFWYTDEVAEHAGLPKDKVVWTYHPVTFVLWMHEKTKGQAAVAKAIQGADAYAGKKPPPDIKDDISDGAEGFMDDEDALFGEAAKKLDLEKLADGYPDQ